MKRLTLSFLVVFLASPFFALAQDTAASDYCPNPETDFFKGSIYYENGKPWIEVKVDPDFEQKVLREERKITGDIPLTPVYDLVVQIKPEFNYYCIPGWVEGAEVTAADLPSAPSIDGILSLGGGKQSIKFSGKAFKRTDKKDDAGRFIYEWKLPGWQSGIVEGELLERLIEAVSKGEQVDVTLLISQGGGEIYTLSSPVSFGLCAPLWGSGEHGIVGMREKGSFNDLMAFFAKFERVRKDGFAQINPYRMFQRDFSYTLDLKNYNTRDEVNAFFELGKNRIRISENNNAIQEILNKSMCSGTRLLYSNSVGIGGFAALGGGGALVGMHPDAPFVAVHEFSHAFAGLNDEYQYRTIRDSYFRIPFRNCSTNPAHDYFYNGRLYGGVRYNGCSYQVAPGGKAVETRNIYRPSVDSLMQGAQHKNPEFNVISCGYILATIKGGDAKSYFPECARMDGIIKDGVQASALYPFFASIGNLLNWRKASQTAAVGDSGEGATGQYLIIESFDPNNPWGEIIEVVPDSQTITSPPAPPTPPPASPAENLGVNNESIFDTISLDLKVNGQDGPVTITPGSRIVVSWISEGATRCRAVWSKNDIKLSGTVAGRLSRSVTIRAACINAEGERADDAVQVLVDTESS